MRQKPGESEVTLSPDLFAFLNGLLLETAFQE